MDQEQRDFVSSIYFDPSKAGSLSSLQNLYDAITKIHGRTDISKSALEKFLLSQELYTSHIKGQSPKIYTSIVSPYPGYGLEIDSAYMPFRDRNRKPFLIVGVDQYSNKIAARPVKSLSATLVNKATLEIIDELGGDFMLIRSDRGVEYRNSVLSTSLKKRKIKHIIAHEPLKASMAESAIKLIKDRTYKVMQHRGIYQWSGFIDDVIKGLNSTKRKALAGYAPDEITGDVVPRIWFHRMERDLKKGAKVKPYKYKIGQSVKIRYNRAGAPFLKAYSETTGARIYYIHDRYRPEQIHLYKIKTDKDELVPGRFRESNLQPVTIDDTTQFRIEGDPIKYRTKNGKREAYVRWLDYPESYNSWIPADNITNLATRNAPSRKRR